MSNARWREWRRGFAAFVASAIVGSGAALLLGRTLVVPAHVPPLSAVAAPAPIAAKDDSRLVPPPQPAIMLRPPAPGDIVSDGFAQLPVGQSYVAKTVTPAATLPAVDQPRKKPAGVRKHNRARNPARKAGPTIVRP